VSTTIATPGDREVVITRVVAAPRRVVFDAWTTPQYVRQWLLGPEGWAMPVCEIDLRPGGRWRYVWRQADGAELAMGGEYREIVAPERIVSTERWGPEWPETVNTVAFSESAGRTTITVTIRYPSREARDAALKTGMKEGMDAGFARLDQLVASLA
jgi:uncharacterized protein YndB with AHSA1/START domain